MSAQRKQLEDTFRMAMDRRPNVPAGEPSTQQGPLVGRKKDISSFVLSVDRIRPDADQVRRMGKSVDDPEIQELAESIRQFGIQQALTVRYIAADDVYELVAGERRFIASTKIVGLAEVPVRVVEKSEEETRLLQLTENIQRVGLHPLDLADGIRALQEHGMGLADVARRLSKSEAWVQKALTVAKSLAPAAQVIAAEGRVDSLDMLYDIAQLPTEEQAPLIQRVVREKLTRADVRVVTAEGKERKRAAGDANRSGRPIKSKPFVKKLAVTGGATVTVQFKKARVATDDVLAALRDAIQKLESPAKAA